MSEPRARALFLDRDGVINHDHGYVHRIEDFQFVAGIFALCRTARDFGMRIHVVTNQAGIARGLYGEAEFGALTAWMLARFAERGAALDAVHHCPFHPAHGLGAWRRDSPRRKPAPGMLLDAAAAHALDLPGSAMVGDRATDMRAAAAAGLGLRLLLSADPVEHAACPAGTRVVASLAEAAAALCGFVGGAGQGSAREAGGKANPGGSGMPGAC